MPQLLYFLMFIALHLSFLSPTEAKARGFSLDLIHVDSPLSPFHNSSLSQSDILKAAARSSISRINHFLPSSNSSENKPIQSPLISNKGEYLMKISIGTPPAEFLAVADTGSDLIWIQCEPCDKCYPQGSPFFDPTNSSTYKELSCNTAPCQSLPKHACTTTNGCEYLYEYGDQSYTNGVLATDTFTFDSTDDRTATFPASVFGCGHNNAGNFQSPGAGLVGLGGGSLSLVLQLGAGIERRFSYCLVSRFSANYTSKLQFGDAAVASGNGLVSTPIISRPERPTFYFLNLEGISVGDTKIGFGSSGPRGNIVIDSGTTLTILESAVYSDVVSTVAEIVGAAPVQDPSRTFASCFQKGSSSSALPDMVFHFTGADVRLKPLNTFAEVDGLVCLTMVPSDQMSIFGNIAQVNFQVEYDLGAKKVSFVPADCTQQ